MRKPSENQQKIQNNTKNSRGRPKKYTKQWIETTLTNKLWKWLQQQVKEDKPIWATDFAYKQGFSVQRLCEFDCKENPRFSEAYARVKALQEQDLVQKGLTNRYNAQFTMFVLKNNHGWKDRQDIVTEPERKEPDDKIMELARRFAIQATNGEKQEKTA